MNQKDKEFLKINDMLVKLWCNTNPKKLLYESPHPGLLPLEKVTMRTYWDWY